MTRLSILDGVFVFGRCWLVPVPGLTPVPTGVQGSQPSHGAAQRAVRGNPGADLSRARGPATALRHGRRQRQAPFDQRRYTCAEQQARCRCGSKRDPRLLSGGRRRSRPAARGRAPAEHERTSISPHPEAGAHHRRPGRRGPSRPLRGAPQGGFAQRIETAHLAEAVQYRPRWQV